MIHGGVIAKIHTVSGGGGGDPPADVPASVTFNPPGDDYPVTSKNVVMTVAGTGVSKLSYRIGGTGSFTVVNALTTTQSVPCTVGGKDLYCKALASDGTTQLGTTRHDVYYYVAA